jgi:hypothetical protein
MAQNYSNVATNILSPNFLAGTSVASPAQLALQNKATPAPLLPVKPVAKAQPAVQTQPATQPTQQSTPQSANPNSNYFGQSQSTAPQPTYTPPTPTYSGLVSQVQQTASQPSQSYLDAMKKAQDINQQLAQSKTQLAEKLSLNAQNPIPIEFQQGRGQIITNQGLAQQNALASEFSGATNLINAANTQQGLQQSGLISAAGLAAPQQYGLTTQPFNPITGEFGGGGTGGAIGRATQAANIGSAQDFQSQIPLY